MFISAAKLPKIISVQQNILKKMILYQTVGLSIFFFKFIYHCDHIIRQIT